MNGPVGCNPNRGGPSGGYYSTLKGQYFRSEAFQSGGKKVKVLGWGGIVDQANTTAQNSSCDLLEADMQVRL